MADLSNIAKLLITTTKQVDKSFSLCKCSKKDYTRQSDRPVDLWSIRNGFFYLNLNFTSLQKSKDYPCNCLPACPTKQFDIFCKTCRLYSTFALKQWGITDSEFNKFVFERTFYDFTLCIATCKESFCAKHFIDFVDRIDVCCKIYPSVNVPDEFKSALSVIFYSCHVEWRSCDERHYYVPNCSESSRYKNLSKLCE